MKPKKRKVSRTRMNTGRKRLLTREQLERRIKLLRTKLLIEQLKIALWEEKWVEKCPTGHLKRHDECDLICEVQAIEPYPTPFVSAAPKIKAKDTYHEWVNDVLTPMVERRVGWWWRPVWRAVDRRLYWWKQAFVQAYRIERSAALGVWKSLWRKR